MNPVPATLTGRAMGDGQRETGMVLTPGRRLSSIGAGSGAAKGGTSARVKMMTTPLPTDDHDRPAWWRNRRRWFYATVAAATLALVGGGWVWWYETDFPLPEKIANSSHWNTTHSPVLIWIMERFVGLFEWKARRIGDQLNLERSVWENLETGAILEFSASGRMKWRKFPGPDLATTLEDEAQMKNIDETRYVVGKIYKFFPPFYGSEIGMAPKTGVIINIYLPDQSDREQILFFNGEEAIFPFVGPRVFTRKSDPF